MDELVGGTRGLFRVSSFHGRRDDLVLVGIAVWGVAVCGSDPTRLGCNEPSILFPLPHPTMDLLSS